MLLNCLTLSPSLIPEVVDKSRETNFEWLDADTFGNFASGDHIANSTKSTNPPIPFVPKVRTVPSVGDTKQIVWEADALPWSGKTCACPSLASTSFIDELPIVRPRIVVSSFVSCSLPTPCWEQSGASSDCAWVGEPAKSMISRNNTNPL